MRKVYPIEFGEHRLEIEINDWAERANASILGRWGDTLILTTAVLGAERETDFVPLTIDYEEKFYAAGKIFGSRFIRREGRPSQTAILNARLIDRSLRPCLKGFNRELQIVNTVLSLDPNSQPELLALLTSSLAIDLLGFIWSGPIAGVTLAKAKNEYQLLPTESIRPESELWLTIAGANKINMIEAEAHEVSENDFLQLCKLGLPQLQKIAQKLRQISSELITERIDYGLDQDLGDWGKKFLTEQGFDLNKLILTKQEGEIDLETIFMALAEAKDKLGEDYPKYHKGVRQEIESFFKQLVLERGQRPDGRHPDEIRPLEAQVDVLPRAHGSALFKRGLTHILSVTTLASPTEELWVQEIEFEGTKRFIHHYNFYPYSVGEIGMLKGPGRREIGHGALVEKSLNPLLPDEQVFPYMIRTVSDVLSSNGSTSMGSLCASALSLLDAGVPLKAIPAGISIGLIYDNDENYQTLVDIQGPEDFFGDMDFKITGTDKGILAAQLDVKIEGLTIELIEKALTQARKSHKFLLDFMGKIINKPRASFKAGVPRIETISINPEKIGLVIGSGGKTIQEITAKTNTKINIAPDGLVSVAGDSQADVTKAVNWIKDIVQELKIGDLVYGKVVKILDFGAIVEISAQKTALLHISEIAPKRIEKITDEIQLGQELPLIIKNITPDGKISVSLKNARTRVTSNQI
jgi:polyribonucleotide nucleotidyltransferase